MHELTAAFTFLRVTLGFRLSKNDRLEPCGAPHK
jgi:hypothetical protein